jgi:RNA polymerase sigma factor (sigma-70 family)
MNEQAPLTSLHIARAAGGDAQSQEWIVARFTPLLLAQARYRLRGRLAAVCEPAGVVQDTWAITLPRLVDLQARDGVWTPVILRFLATTLLRRINHLARKHLAAGRPLAQGGDTQPPTLSAHLTGVITHAHRDDVAGAVRRALDALPDDEREVMVLRGIEQLSNGEVARLLGVEDFVVTRRFQRGLAHLRQALPDSVFAELV